jgi:hypothetical protein
MASHVQQILNVRMAIACMDIVGQIMFIAEILIAIVKNHAPAVQLIVVHVQSQRKRHSRRL